MFQPYTIRLEDDGKYYVCKPTTRERDDKGIPYVIEGVHLSDGYDTEENAENEAFNMFYGDGKLY